MKKKIKTLSLFSNVGVAEAYFKQIGIDVKVANELEQKRADFYSHLYPDVEMVVGDITKAETKKAIIDKYGEKGLVEVEISRGTGLL